MPILNLAVVLCIWLPRNDSVSGQDGRSIVRYSIRSLLVPDCTKARLERLDTVRKATSNLAIPYTALRHAVENTLPTRWLPNIYRLLIERVLGQKWLNKQKSRYFKL